LKWEDVDWDKRTIKIRRTKTQVGSEIVVKETKTYTSNRKLYIPDGLYAALEEELNRQQKNSIAFGEAWNDTGYIIVWEDGRPYRPNYLSELFTKFLIDNGLPKIVLHELRHTFASLSNEAGVQEFNIGKALGHANVGTTKKIYTHLFDDKHTAAVDAVANMIDSRKDG
jgi:integrase